MGQLTPTLTLQRTIIWYNELNFNYTTKLMKGEAKMFHEESVMASRLSFKSDDQTFASNFTTRYSMSKAEAECLTKELKETLSKDTTYIADGQEFFSAIAINEPPGKPIKDCQTLMVKLTLRCPEDLQVRSTQGIKGYLKNSISRICWETLAQNALLTQEDLCFLLNTSRANVKRLLRQYRQQGDYIPTRGNFHDIGPGISHKYEAVRLYIKGLLPTDIAMRLGHSLNSIERYIEDFSLVVSASLEDYNAIAIARFTGISEKVVKEYLVLYDRYCLDPELKPFLEQLIDDFKRKKLFKKKQTETQNESKN